MTVNEFAKYVINNLSRASLTNAFNIGEKLDNPDFYKLDEFITNCNAYVVVLLDEGKINQIKASKLLIALNKCEKALRSEFNFNKKMIIDNLIIEMWEACCGH